MKRFFILLGWLCAIFLVLYFPTWNLFPSDEKTINIFAWGDTLNSEILREFEEETGIKINISHYSSNEELIVKMEATKGAGYDLIMPSDYAVTLLAKGGLLQPIDKEKLFFLSNLTPSLLDLSFDPGNTYSLPFEWELYGIGYSPEFFHGRPPPRSWSALFDKETINYKIAMHNDPIEAIQAAALYLYGKTENLSSTQFSAIKKLLIEQNSWVEAYSDGRPDYFLATGSCPVIMTITPLIHRLIEVYPEAKFIIPDEGTFISVENFCIPKTSTNQDLVYQLLNYLYTDQSLIRHYDQFGFFPATKTALEALPLSPMEKRTIDYLENNFDHLHFFKNIFPHKEVIDLWVQVKSF